MSEQILDCGHPPSPHGAHTTGYGIDPEGKKHCWDCCAKHDRADMIETGRAVLYLCGPQVTNWPGTLKFSVKHYRQGRHNFARCRHDVWFDGPDGYEWHGVTYGDNTQLCHCRRTKTKAQ